MIGGGTSGPCNTLPEAWPSPPHCAAPDVEKVVRAEAALIRATLDAILVDTRALRQRLPDAPVEPDRIRVDVRKQTITIDGSEKLLRSEQQAEVLAVLHHFAPGVVTPALFKEREVLVGNPSRVIRGLPSDVRRHVESIPGVGTRLRFR